MPDDKSTTAASPPAPDREPEAPRESPAPREPGREPDAARHPQREPEAANELHRETTERPPVVDDADAGTPPHKQALLRRRLVAWIAAATAAIVVIAIVVATRRHAHRPSEPGARPPGGAALRATPTPTIRGQVTGVRLTGFVVDGAGLPVAGAEVSAELEHGAPDRALAPPPRAGSAAANSTIPAAAVAGDAAVGDSGTAVAIAPLTGADGRFVVDGLVAGRFRVRVTGAGLLPAEVRYVPVPSDEARIVVARQVAIDGTVTDGGKPVGNATVGLRGDVIGGTIELRTTAAGAFHFGNLPEGRYQLFAWQAALAARTVRVARLGAGPFGPIELRLEAASIVVGRVIDRDEGTGLVAAIELRPSGDDQAPRYVRSGEDGVFRIEGVPSGHWIADAFVPGYLSPGGIELEAGRGVPELALVRGGVISGRVLDSEGHPIAGALVRALTAGSNAAEVSAEVDRDKLRRFSGRTAAPVPVSPAGGLDRDPELVARGELGVLVGPIPPIPPPGAHVAQSAVAIDPSLAGDPAGLAGDPARVAIWTTGADGSYRITGFAKAKVTVLASARGFAETRGRQLAIEPGQVVAGVDLVFTPGTLVLGKVTDQHGAPVVGAQVTATPVGASPHDAAGAALDAFTDDTGGYKLGPVAGTVELHATAYGHGEARRTIDLAAVPGTTPAERHEDLVLAVADAMVAGILEDATGAAVRGAQLEVVGGVGDGRRAIAAADGTFALDLLPAGRLRLHIEHPAYPPEDVDVVAAAGNPARTRLRLPLGGGVEGALLDAASGAPIASVSLAATGPGNALAEGSTDRAGRWKLGPLTPGRWRIAVKQPGYLTQTRELDVPVAHVPGGTSVHDIRLELARGALLGGTVRDARGQRTAAAHVVIAGAGQTCEADTDGQGEFRIHDCPTGDLVVAATKAGLRGETRATVHPGHEVLGVSIELR